MNHTQLLSLWSLQTLKAINSLAQKAKTVKKRKSLRKLSIAIITGSLVMSTAACSQQSGDPITIGISNFFTALDPAGSYSVVDQEIMFHIYPTLLTNLPGEVELRGEIAESFGFVDPNTYEVKLKPGLKFANGNDLTASDVVHSYRRQSTVAAPISPVSLLSGISEINEIDELTIQFKLNTPNDQTISHVLSSTAGLIVDEEFFPADALLENSDIVEARPFAGQYEMNAVSQDEFISYVPNNSYAGILGKPKNSGIIARYFTDPSNLVLAAKKGEIDVTMGWRSLTGTQVDDLAASGLELIYGQGAEPYFLTFDSRNQPFGSETDNADAAKAFAVRQAAAFVIDSAAIAKEAYFDSVEVSKSMVPKSLPGYFDAFTLIYGNQPDLAKAKQVLNQASVSYPIEFELSYAIDRYGPVTASAMTQLKDQLEQSGLFAVSLNAMEWSAFREARTNGQLEVWHLGWGPDFGEADNYLTPILKSDIAWLKSGYVNPELDQLLVSQRSEADPAKREAILKQIQEIVVKDLPAIPLIQAGRFALVRPEIKGFAETLDASFKFRYSNLSR
jgi:peptide/nickel transport system substrate-binding protein